MTGQGNLDRAPWIIAGGVVLAALIVAVALVSVNGRETLSRDPGVAETALIGAQARAQDRAAQSDLRDALVGAKTLYTDTSTYAGATTSGMSGVAPELTFITTPSNTTNLAVSIMTTPTATLWGEARMSASGTCYGMRETSANGTYYISNLSTCTGDAASTDTGTLRSFT